jgi:hypothetical protein
MTDDPKNDAADAPEPSEGASPVGRPDPLPASDSPATSADPNRLTPAWARFRSCRWRSDPEDGEYCTHRDVLPYAGKEGFNPESWCPECPYFKLKRVARKPSY